jgi:hypothetical protein
MRKPIVQSYLSHCKGIVSSNWPKTSITTCPPNWPNHRCSTHTYSWSVLFRKPSNPTTEQVCWTDLGLHLKPKAQNHMHCYTSRVTYVIELFGSDRGRSIAQPRIFPETASFSIPSFSSTQRNKTNLSLTYRMPHQKQESPALGNTPQSALLHIVFMQNTLQSLTSQAICTKAQHSYCCEV